MADAVNSQTLFDGESQAVMKLFSRLMYQL
jgi:hypothetical protein